MAKEFPTEITDETIKQTALWYGFKLREQPTGEPDLNPYVYRFGRALVRLARPPRELPNQVKIDVSSDPRQFDLIQSLAFKYGGEWNSGSVEYSGNYMPYLFISHDLRITYSADKSWFDDYEAQQMTFEDFAELLRESSKSNLYSKQREITQWSDNTFGDKSPIEIATRMNNEVAELLTGLANNPEAINEHAGECADVLIMLVQVAHKLGVDLEAELDKKMVINKDRQWTVLASGKAQHV